MKLFLVHCGFYDPEVGEGVYEGHTNIFVVADDFVTARAEAKKNEMFQNKKMHIDGLQQIDAVSGFRVGLVLDEALEGKSEVMSHRFHELAQKKKEAETHSAH